MTRRLVSVDDAYQLPDLVIDGTKAPLVEAARPTSGELLAGASTTTIVTPAELVSALEGVPPQLGVETALTLDGTIGCYASMPHVASLASLTYLEIVVRAKLSDYTSGAGQQLVAKESSSTTRSFRFFLNSTGQMNFTRSTDGSSASSTSRPNPGFVDGTEYWLKVDWRLSDGRVRFWWAPTSPTEPRYWVQNVNDATLTGAIHDNASPVEIGSRLLGTSERLTGSVKQVIIRTSDGGVPVAAADFTTGRLRRRTDLRSNTWTMNGTSALAAPTAAPITGVPTDVYIRATPDFNVNAGTGTDLTAEFQLAIAAVPAYGRLIIPPAPDGYAYAVRAGQLIVDKPMTILGLNRWSSRIVAYPGATGYLIRVQPGSMLQSSHMFEFHMRDVQLDGRRRAEDVGGIDIATTDRIVMERVEMRNFQREGLLLSKNVRESEWRSVYMYFCGSYGTYAAMSISDITDTGGDQTNGLAFQGIKILYPFGSALLIAPANNANPTRSIFFNGGMFHGLIDDQLAGNPTVDGYTPAVVDTQVANALIDVADCRSLYFSGCRFHSPGFGMATIRVRRGARNPSKNRVFVTNSDFGQCQQKTLTGVSSVAATDRFTSATHNLGTGAVVRVTGAGLGGTTDYFVIRVDGNTFSVATSLLDAQAGTVAPLTDDTGITVTTQQIHVENYEGVVSVTNSSFDISSNRANLVNRTGAATDTIYSANYSNSTEFEDVP